VDILKSSEIDAADREIVKGNFHYYAIAGSTPGELPQFTTTCTVASLGPYVVSETVGNRAQQRQIYQGASLDAPQGTPVLAAISLTEGGDHEQA
jgi:murein DD-endopeptidase MepM/ murein hydrolase activator NlpD